ncbi:MAG: serine hydrolase [Steroidobacter sp.]|nr:serine hydrolase [Steroidobacter sp.]
MVVNVTASAGSTATELATVTGAAAKVACSAVFVSGFSLSRAAVDVEQLLRPLAHEFVYEIERRERRLSASASGVVRTALYRPGLGCTLLMETDEPMLRQQAIGVPLPKAVPSQLPWPAGERVDARQLSPGIDRAALNAAMDAALRDETPAGEIDTRALVVVHRGRIVAERYAAGYSKDTRFLGWSASKSVIAALIGTLVTDGKLTLDAEAPVASWHGADDPRRAIKLRHLLTMSSGLAFQEGYYAPGDDSTAMLFERGDMAAYAQSKLLAHELDRVFSYSSGTTNILARIYLDATGGSVLASEEHARRRLFEPAGMSSAVFERDASGAVVGSSYFFATARDWARFGLLHLNRGEINGQRVLAPEWVDFIRAPSSADDRYGGQFWLNDFKDGATERRFPGVPADTYFALGHNSQIVAIIPSRQVVIVRLGWTRGAGRFDLNRHFAAMLDALGESRESDR